MSARPIPPRTPPLVTPFVALTAAGPEADPPAAIVLCRSCRAVADAADPPGWAVTARPLATRPTFAVGVCPRCRGRG